MLIIGGTSLTVYPAASYIDYFRGKYLVIINQSPLNIKTDSNTLVVSERIGDFFRQVAKEEGVEL
jgi:NAD-dependent deacetylase